MFAKILAFANANKTKLLGAVQTMSGALFAYFTAPNAANLTLVVAGLLTTAFGFLNNPKP
jgi:hypothetical protein